MPSTLSTECDLAIIGGGPAGMNAALYASRRALKTVLIEEKMLGGMLNEMREIDNYLGFPKSTGPALKEAFAKHLANFEVETREFEAVEAVSRENGSFMLSTSAGKLTAKAIILATGMKHSGLGLESEKKLLGKGVSYCATCDAPFFKGKEVAVVGGGDSAVSAALYLCDVASRVYLISRSELRAVEALVEKLREKEKQGIAKLLPRTKVVELEGETRLLGVDVEEENATRTRISVDGAFIYVGGVPLNALAQSLGVKMNARGFIDCDENGATEVAGVYVAGDVTGKGMQVISAAASGASAALAAYQHIRQKVTTNQ